MRTFPPVKYRAVIYRGSTGIDEDGIIYLNAEEYLKKTAALRKEAQPEVSEWIFREASLPLLRGDGIGNKIRRQRYSGRRHNGF